MKKTWIALLLALCMLTALGAASACGVDNCCASPSGMDEAQTMEETCPCMMDGKGVNGCPCADEAQTMEETCPCMMDGKGVNGCPCVSDKCGEDCLCMDGKSCMQDGMCAEGCMCEKQCACDNECACAEKKLEMLTAEMNAVFEANMDLWNKFFGMLDKQPDMSMTYAEYLMKQLETMKEKFTEDEYNLLMRDIETIRRIDEEIAMLQKKQLPTDQGMTQDGMDMDTMKDGMDMDMMKDGMDMMEEDTSAKFPAFEGMDLDGNPVTSELFKENSVTVVNFWFSTCAPCIGELGELNALNETLRLRGGEVIGVNADTLDGNEKMIMAAKKLLEKKGASYRNIYFPSDSEAGKLTYSIMAFPTTVVVDRNGRMVGEPVLGSINNKAQMKALQALIDETLARDVMALDKDMMMKPDAM